MGHDTTAYSKTSKRGSVAEHEGDNICNMLLKMYKKTYLKYPKITNLQQNHVADILFSKQSKHRLPYERRCSLKLEMRDTSLNKTTVDVDEEAGEAKRKVKGALRMDQQLPRKNLPPQPAVPNYTPSYKLVLPRVTIPVDYQKDIKRHHNRKHKGRVPLLTPWIKKKTQRNKSFAL